MKTAKKSIRKPPFATTTSPSAPVPANSDNNSLWQNSFVHILLILCTGFVVYFNSINVPFMFDDYSYLVKNPAIKSFSCFPDTENVFDLAIEQDIKHNLILRPVAYFTFAVNYSLHELDLFGYHMVNLLLHVGNGMLVYCFLAQLMSTPAMVNEKQIGETKPNSLALFIALLFVCHPIQTQAVTYIIQRFVPLATLFYLTSLVLYLEFRRVSTPRSRVWMYLLSLMAAILAMESKEIAFTLPIVIALVEFIFFQGATIPRFGAVVPFLLTMIIIPAKLMQLSSVSPEKAESTSNAMNLVNFGGTSSLDYLMTQFGVIATYIRLLFLPFGQNFDYDYPLQQSFFKTDVLLPLAMLLMFVGIGLYFLNQSKENPLYKIIAFGIFWFFITISIESSIVPIADLIFEHRAYLPSVGFFMTCLAGISIIFKRLTGKTITQSTIAHLLLISAIVALSITSIVRNNLWQDDVAFWSDVVNKCPNKARAHRWLGATLLQHSKHVPEDHVKNRSEDAVSLKAGSKKQVEAAIKAFKEAIRIDPKNSIAYLLLADALILQKNYDEAERALSTASELQPTSPIPYTMRGELLESKNDIARARQQYSEAIKIDPSYHVTHVKLADIYAKGGNTVAAIKELELALRVYPDETIRRKIERLKSK